MPTTNFKAIDLDTGMVLLSSIPSVLDPVELTSVATTSGSELITVASTTGVFPFMGVSCAGIPAGALVKAVKSSTVLELAVPMSQPGEAWQPSTVYVVGQVVSCAERDFICTAAHTSTALVTLGAGNYIATLQAQERVIRTMLVDIIAGKWRAITLPMVVPALATATLSSMTAHAHGFNPVAVPEPVVTGETYRNRITGDVSALRKSGENQVGTPVANSITLNKTALVARDADVLATWYSADLNFQTETGYRVRTDDETAGIPPRQLVKMVSYYYFVKALGAVQKVPALPNVGISIAA